MAKKPIPPEVRAKIRLAYGDGSRVSLTDVALEFGVAVSTVGAIVNNHTRAKALADEMKVNAAPPGEKVK
jgi:hypothetical protein